MTLPEPLAVTLLVTGALENAGVRYFIGGSLASSAQGAARSTLDADVVADLRSEHVVPFLRTLGDAFYFDADTVRRAVRTRGSFNLIHLETMFKVDIFVNKGRPFDEAQFDRSMLHIINPEPPQSAYLSSAEDTVLAKLEWYRRGGEVSDRQWRDVIEVLRAQSGRLDEDYLRRWAAQLGVDDLLREAHAEAEQTA